MNNLDSPAMPTTVEVKHPDSGFVVSSNDYTGLTKREQAALTLRIPMSGDEELDKMIRAARRLDIATTFMQGFIADDEIENWMWKRVHAEADALLKEAGL